MAVAKISVSLLRYAALLLAQPISCCRFEAMALEYDSDDIGDLDDDAEDTIQGPATVEQFDNLLTEFLEDHPTQDHNHEAGYAYDAAGGSVAGGPIDRAAVAKVNNLKPAYSQDVVERWTADYMRTRSY